MNKVSKIVVVAVVGTLVLSGVAIAGRHSCFGSSGGGQVWFDSSTPQERAGRMVQRIGERLELNGDQQAKLENLAAHLISIRADMGDEKKNLRNSMVALLNAPELDKERAMGIVNEKLRAAQANAPEVLEAVANFTDSLDSGQRLALVHRLEQGGARWKKGFRP